MTNSLSNVSLFKIVLSAAAIVIILTGVKLVASILNPVLIAIFISVLIRPFYQWLLAKRMSSGLALLLTVVAILLIGGGLILFVLMSFSRLADGLSGYSAQISENLETLLGQLSAINIDLSGLLNSEFLAQLLLSFASGIVGLASMALLVLVMILFTVAEASQFGKRMRDSLGVDSEMWLRTKNFVNSIVIYFGLRTRVNLLTGTLVFILLLVLRVDYAPLWGILTFFLSYVPYIGIFVATVPSVLLAFAEGGIVGAGLVILGVSVINIVAENVFAPSMMGRGLSLSPLLVFVAFIFWTWLLGVSGTMMAMPITVAIVLLLDAFDETRWVARLCGFGGMGGGDQVKAEGADM